MTSSGIEPATFRFVTWRLNHVLLLGWSVCTFNSSCNIFFCSYVRYVDITFSIMLLRLSAKYACSFLKSSD
jgi:hypothetical protein